MKKKLSREERRMERRAIYHELSSKKMKMAHLLMTEEGYSSSMALKLAHGAVQLHRLLRKGTVCFDYFKENGEQRTAFGTLCEDASDCYARAMGALKKIRPDYDEKVDADKLERGLITYFDLEKMGWRTCKACNLVCISYVTIPIHKFFR